MLPHLTGHRRCPRSTEFQGPRNAGEFRETPSECMGSGSPAGLAQKGGQEGDTADSLETPCPCSAMICLERRGRRQGPQKGPALHRILLLLSCINGPRTWGMKTERKGKIGHPPFLFLPVLFSSSIRERERVWVEVVPRSEIGRARSSTFIVLVGIKCTHMTS